MSDIFVKTNNLSLLINELGHSQKNMELAVRKSIKFFLTMIRKSITSAIKQKIGLPESEMKKFRIRGRGTSRGLAVELWIGENAVAARFLNPSVKGNGIQAGGQFFPRAFFAKQKSGSTLILQRTSESDSTLKAPQISMLEIAEATLSQEWQKFQTFFDQRISYELSNLTK